MSWQADLVQRLRAARALDAVEPYGSTGAALDGWSDLDVEVAVIAGAGVEELLGAPLWAWQEGEEDRRVLRLVLRDGRRVDLRIAGQRLRLPDAPADLAVRFDAALAATRFGRGNDLIGLHLVLGVLRAALVQRMLLADRRTGTSIHRVPTLEDRRADAVRAVVAGPLGPASALEAYALYGRWRAELDPTYSPDPSGLEAVLARGLDPR